MIRYLKSSRKTNKESVPRSFWEASTHAQLSYSKRGAISRRYYDNRQRTTKMLQVVAHTQQFFSIFKCDEVRTVTKCMFCSTSAAKEITRYGIGFIMTVTSKNIDPLECW